MFFLKKIITYLRNYNINKKFTLSKYLIKYLNSLAGKKELV